MSLRDQVLDVLRASRQPLAMPEIEAALPDSPRRSLQRLMGQLVSAGEVERTGEKRWSRYRLVDPLAIPRLVDAAVASEEVIRPRAPFDGIPVGPDAAEVLALVSRPLVARTPVGYQREILEDYVPNETYLLPAVDRQRLLRLGTTEASGLPAGTFGREVLQRLLIDLSWASSHLEGNTYTRLDTRELIEHSRVAEGRTRVETQMILNHKRAIELIVEEAGDLQLDVFTLRGIHGALSENLMSDQGDEGRIRQRPVSIGGSVFHPLSVPDQIEELLRLLLSKATQIVDAFERSFFLLVHLPYLQPFADVNKRVARLVANIPLVQQNLCPLTFVDVPPHAYALAVLGFYELGRPELMRDLYLWAYERSTREFLEVQRAVQQPNPLRTLYREEIHEIVRRVVRGQGPDELKVIDDSVVELIPEADRSALHGILIAEIRGLHEGTVSLSLDPGGVAALDCTTNQCMK